MDYPVFMQLGMIGLVRIGASSVRGATSIEDLAARMDAGDKKVDGGRRDSSIVEPGTEN